MLHIANQAVQYGNKVIQRCALCGTKIIHATVIDGMEKFPVYEPGTLVWMETNADGTTTAHEVDELENFPQITYGDIHRWRLTICTEMEFNTPDEEDEDDIFYDLDKYFEDNFDDED